MKTHPFAAAAAALSFVAAQASARAQPADPAAGANQPAPASTPAGTKASKAHDPNRIICRQEEEIGTRLGGQRICHTWSEWQAIARNSADALNSVQSLGSHTNPGGH